MTATGEPTGPTEEVAEQGGAPPAVPVQQLGYSQAAGELDDIIAELDRGVIDVDVLEQRLCRAVEIVEELDRRIRGARERVSAILPRLESAGRGEGGEAPPATV